MSKLTHIFDAIAFNHENFNILPNNKNNKSLVAILATPLKVSKVKALPVLTAYAAFCESASELPEEELKAIKEAVAPRAYEIEVTEGETFEDFKLDSATELKISNGDPFASAKSGSVAVIPVRGVMMRESGWTWSYGYVTGTRELEQVVKAAEASPNIGSIIFQLKSPGGEASGNESLSRVIRSCSKPTLVSFEGMASAALEAFIGATEIWALEKDSYFGSLGTLASLVDDKKYWEDMGVKFVDIYAPQSTLKNHEVREALEGNPEPMQERLGKSTDFFIKDVKKARPSIVDDGKIFKGALYNAVEATKIGAIDGVKDFDSVLKRAAYLGRKQQRTNTNKKAMPQEENKNNELAAVENKETATEETVQVSKSGLEALKSLFGIGSKQADPELEKANKEVETLTTKVASYEKTIAELTTDKKALEERVSALEADKSKAAEQLQADLQEAKTLEGEESFKTVADVVKAYNETFEHNKELGGEGKAPATPVDTQETTSDVGSDTTKTVMSLAERRKQIEAELAAEKKAKAEKEK